MNALKLSAQFAAYVWYTETNRGPGAHAAAVRFAREGWQAFLPSAHEGWGQLLLRVAQGDPDSEPRDGQRFARPAQKRPIREMAQAS